MAGMFEGKKVMIFGVANERSIAWGIAQAMHAEGATLGFTYVGEALERRVRPLAESLGSDVILPCDVTREDEVKDVFRVLEETWGGLDVLVHSVAFARREDLDGRFVDTSRVGFMTALDISAYSLVLLAREAEPLLKKSQGNIITMTYYGSVKVVQNYNIMGVAKATLEACVRYLANDLGPEGIRINAISAGPIKTLAAGGIKGFKTILDKIQSRAPLRRTIDQTDVAKTALFLASDLASGVTGDTLYVDSGYNLLGL